MTGPEVLHSRLTSGNPATLTGLRDSLSASMRSIDSSADSLVLASSGVTWQGSDRTSYNQRIWATKAMAEMAHLRCSQGKVALKSVRRAYAATERVADLVIMTWRTNKALPLDGPALARARNQAVDALTTLTDNYAKVLLAATDYLPTDGLAQGEGSREDWERYLETGGLTDEQREALQDGLGYSMTEGLQDGTLPGPVIADTEVTGNDDGWTPQGIGYSNANGGTVVQVSYGGPGNDDAVASIIDPDTGELINTVKLDAPPGHVGGVVVDGNDVWVTGGDPSRAVRYSLSDLRDGTLGQSVPSRGEAALKDGGHSFSTIHTDPGGTTYLYAGNFWDDRMYRYEKVGDSWVRDPDYEVKTPEFTQGVVVTDGEISFSTSYGRDYESELKTYQRGTLEGGGDASDGDGLISSTYLPNMSEGMVLTPDGLAVVHESGADGYIGTGDEWVSPFMSLLHPGSAGISGEGIEVDPATLRQAARKLGTVEGELQTAARAIYGLNLPASALGRVEGAADFAQALNLHLDATGIWLKRSEISAGIGIDGLLGSADEHERADSFWRDKYEWDREHLGIADKAKEAYEEGREKGGELIDKGKDVYEDVTPWEGTFPG